MNTLWAFGCSLTHGDELPEDDFKNWTKFNLPDVYAISQKKYADITAAERKIWLSERSKYFGNQYDIKCNELSYPSLVANKIGLRCKNLAYPGFGHIAIAISIAKNLRYMNTSDLVMIGSTFLNRIITDHGSGRISSHNINVTSEIIEILPDPLFSAVTEFLMLEDVINKLTRKKIKILMYDTIGLEGHMSYLRELYEHENNQVFDLANQLNPFNDKIPVMRYFGKNRCTLNHPDAATHIKISEYIIENFNDL